MISLSTTVPANEARRNFYQLLREVGKNLGQYTVTLRGRAQAVIISPEEFDSWLETLDVASDKKLVRSIRKGVGSGKIYSQEEADKLIGW